MKLHELRAAVLAALGCCGLAFTAFAGEPQDIDIPSGTLIAALETLGKQFGVELAYRPELVKDLRTSGVRGKISAEDAVKQLLQGTPLSVRTDTTGVLVISDAKPSGARSSLLLRDQLDSPDAVEEVIVTGKGTLDLLSFGKEAQTLRNIPQSVSIMTRQRMEDQNITTLGEVLDSTVGIFAHDQGDGGGSVNAYARGNLMGAQFDGVAGSRSVVMGDSQFDMAIYDRVEVLRGPAGLATGVGELGGTVNMVRKRPRDQFGAGASLSVGSWNNYHGDVDFTGPLSASGRLRGRAVLIGEQRDYFYDKADKQSWTGYGIVEFDVTEATTVGLSAGVQRTDLTPTNGQPMYVYGDGSYALLGAPRSINLITGWSTVKRNIDEQVFDVVHRFDNGWKVKLNVNRRESLFDYRAGEPSSPIDAATDQMDFWAATYAIEYESLGIDINVTGSVELFGRKHDLLLGFNVDRFDREIPWGGASLGSLNAFNPGVDASVVPARTFSLGSRVDQQGVYGMARISLLDPLTVILGGRVSDYSDASRGFAPIDSPVPWQDGEPTNGEFTPYAGVVWDISREFSWYGSYTQVFQPQSDLDYQANLLDPRVGYQVETGLKGEHFDGRLNTSFAVFRLRDSNLATPDTDPNHPCFNGDVCYKAAGLIETKGWEMEIVGRLQPGWDLTLGYTAYSQEDAQTGEAFNTRLPDHVFKLWSNYRFDGSLFGGALQGWNVGLGVHKQNGVYYAEGTPAVTIVEADGYTVADLQVGYKVSEKLRTTLTISNLFDRNYYSAIWDASARNMYGEPRAVMLTVRATL
ncbi:TonB-dependent siderophore receptor [Steroidobacter sp.]|uniref:TonB-dependent siderophore receptor n=1 Tax=Steroidobacter sp. TaxID=1978227 RepID=UPI001A40C665|nr:TonB-dependent receptor [Steroidobacter sp.]MBL8266802.1 TonB-dependent siderophore receptor [Steroidobacter sp.]